MNLLKGGQGTSDEQIEDSGQVLTLAFCVIVIIVVLGVLIGLVI